MLKALACRALPIRLRARPRLVIRRRIWARRRRGTPRRPFGPPRFAPGGSGRARFAPPARAAGFGSHRPRAPRLGLGRPRGTPVRGAESVGRSPSSTRGAAAAAPFCAATARGHSSRLAVGPGRGSPIRTEPPGSEGLAATDRPLVSAMPFGSASSTFLWRSTRRAPGEEPLDLIEVEAAPAPAPYRRAGSSSRIPAERVRARDARARGGIAARGAPFTTETATRGSWIRQPVSRRPRSAGDRGIVRATSGKRVAPLNHAGDALRLGVRPPARARTHALDRGARDGVEHR